MIRLIRAARARSFAKGLRRRRRICGGRCLFGGRRTRHLRVFFLLLSWLLLPVLLLGVRSHGGGCLGS